MILNPIFRSIIKKSLHFRGDGWPSAPYYFPWTWENLECEPFSFFSGKWRINGLRYWKKGNSKPKATVAFYHGIGAGHYAYVNLINLLAQAGYLVYAYDNQGSGFSEGTAIDSLSVSVVNQKDFYAFLDQDPKARGLPRYACGHSWGGFTALCALQSEYGVSKVCSISGFDSVANILCDLNKSAAKFKKTLLSVQKHDFGELGLLSGLELMKKTDAKVLYIQGDKDTLVPYQTNGKVFQKELKDKPNIRFLIRKGWGHNPYWDRKTEEYEIKLNDPKEGMGSFNRSPNLRFRDELLRSVDPLVAKAIVDFFRS